MVFFNPSMRRVDMGIGPGVDCLGSGDVTGVCVDVVQWSRC